MTEAEWLARKDPKSMLEYLTAKVSDRKLRLFSAACCRISWGGELSAQSRRTIETVERYADGLASDEELLTAGERVREAFGRQWGSAYQSAYQAVIEASHESAPVAARLALRHATESAIDSFWPWMWSISGRRNDKALTRSTRDIFGNPFRSVTFSPSWRTDTAVAIAQQMYESRDFGAMPILADALQDAGCDSTDILNHCRDPKAGGGSGEPAGGSSAQGVHVRGCWVVDLVLGKK